MNILLCGHESPLGALTSQLLGTQGVGKQRLLPEQTLTGLSVADIANHIREHQADIVLNLQHLPFSSPAKRLDQAYVQVPDRLAQAAAATGITLLHLSDSQIFAGRSSGSYRETDEPDTQMAYGALRWAGEQVVVQHCPRHVIVRTGELFGSEGENVMTRLLMAWHKGESAPVSLRYQFCPTPLQDAARVIVAMLKQLDCGISPWGIYHYCGTDVVSYHDFARLLKQILEGQENWHSPMAMHEIADGQPALSWALDCGKIRDTFGIKQHAWRAGFTSSIKQTLAQFDNTAAG